MPPFAPCFVKDCCKQALLPVIHGPLLDGFKKVLKQFFFRKALARLGRIVLLFFGKAFIP
jgi:hypothetical protein